MLSDKITGNINSTNVLCHKTFKGHINNLPGINWIADEILEMVVIKYQDALLENAKATI